MIARLCGFSASGGRSIVVRTGGTRRRGRLVLPRTSWATLPKSSLRIPVRPWVAMTIRSAPILRDWETISAAAGPSTMAEEHSSPAVRTFSARSSIFRWILIRSSGVGSGSGGGTAPPMDATIGIGGA